MLRDPEPSPSHASSRSSLRVLIANTMVLSSLDKVPGVILDEALQFGEVSASVEVLVFATGPPRYRSFGKSVRLYTIPAPSSSIVFWRLWPVMTFLVALYVTLICLSRRVNIVRADDTLKVGFGSLIGSRICRLPFVDILGGDYLEILQTRSSKSANLMSTVFRAIQSTVLSGSSIVVTY